LRMQTQGTERRFKRLVSRLRGRETASTTTSPTSTGENQAPQSENTVYNDRELALSRYRKAASQLKEAIKIRKGVWSAFDFDEFCDEPEDIDDSQFKNKINTVFGSQETSIKDKKGWSKFTYAVECVFTALSPFAKNFLMATQGTQSVLPFHHLFICILIIVYIDTIIQSIWCDLQRSLAFNNGSHVVILRV
jgi:hypothetical protein